MKFKLILCFSLIVLARPAFSDYVGKVASILDACRTQSPIYDVKAFNEVGKQQILLSTFFNASRFDLARIPLTEIEAVDAEGTILKFTCKDFLGCMEFGVGEISVDGVSLLKRDKVSRYDFIGCADSDVIYKVKDIINNKQ